MSDADTNCEIDIKALHTFIVCDACEENNPPLRCSRCKVAYYCSSECQRMHWKEHKSDCQLGASIHNFSEGFEATVPSEQDDVSSAVNSECGICLEEEISDPIVLGNCKHAFCFLCLKEWQNYSKKLLVHQQSATVPSSCPLCRQRIVVDLVEECTEKAKLYAARGCKESLSQEERSECYSLALQQVDKILTGDSEDGDIVTMILKASILTHTNPVEAIQLFEKIFTVDEKGASNRGKLIALLDRSKNAMDRGDEELAERLMDDVEAFHQKTYLRHIGRVDDPTRLFDIKLMLAEAHEAAGQWREALDVYKEMLEQLDNPDTATPRQTRSIFAGASRCLYELKMYEKAVNAGEAALSMNRHFPGVHKLLARPQRAMGKIQLAVANMSRGVIYETPWDDLNRQSNIAFLQVLKQEQLHLAEEETAL
jgi:tetratricopeptide (TPR) repeat protein